MQDKMSQSGLLVQMNKNARENSANEQISARLKQERKRIGLNQTTFSESINTALSSYVKYEQGKRVIPADKLLELKKTGADVCFILTGKRVSHPEGHLESRFARLDQRSQQVVQELINLLLSD
ncbi:helix-turn-helix domain-containing protein [Idiomarina abyssalis]|uniref:helix-turn-helix domain-containing protein n=1 Tax=Idiomarina abyssalis TaxID=86102 RepID=UPI001CD2D9A9|nr:helix-turn-helix transcriptional regulator [Idiomarina abyssalis]